MLVMINSSKLQYQRQKIALDEKEVNEQMPLFIACVIFRAAGWRVFFVLEDFFS